MRPEGEEKEKLSGGGDNKGRSHKVLSELSREEATQECPARGVEHERVEDRKLEHEEKIDCEGGSHR